MCVDVCPILIGSRVTSGPIFTVVSGLQTGSPFFLECFEEVYVYIFIELISKIKEYSTLNIQLNARLMCKYNMSLLKIKLYSQQ